jgi:hypothetical protein
MYCIKCYSDPCSCKKDDDVLFPKETKCLTCGGTGWERFISKNDVHDPHSYDGTCRACGGKGYR